MSFYINASNLHKSFFEKKLPLQPTRRTREDVEIERSVPIDLRRPRKSFKLYEEDSKRNVRKVLGNVISPTRLSNMFFSNANIQQLQNYIRYQVYKEIKHVISEQDDTDLLIIMRAIYLQYSNNDPSCDTERLQKEIDRLNLYVIRDAVPDIITNILQYFGYLRDAGRIQPPIERPLSLSNKGTKELRSQMDILAPQGDPLSNGNRPVVGNAPIEANFEGFRNF